MRTSLALVAFLIRWQRYHDHITEGVRLAAMECNAKRIVTHGMIYAVRKVRVSKRVTRCAAELTHSELDRVLVYGDNDNVILYAAVSIGAAVVRRHQLGRLTLHIYLTCEWHIYMRLTHAVEAVGEFEIRLIVYLHTSKHLSSLLTLL